MTCFLGKVCRILKQTNKTWKYPEFQLAVAGQNVSLRLVEGDCKSLLQAGDSGESGLYLVAS